MFSACDSSRLHDTRDSICCLAWPGRSDGADGRKATPFFNVGRPLSSTCPEARLFHPCHQQASKTPMSPLHSAQFHHWKFTALGTSQFTPAWDGMGSRDRPGARPTRTITSRRFKNAHVPHSGWATACGRLSRYAGAAFGQRHDGNLCRSPSMDCHLVR